MLHSNVASRAFAMGPELMRGVAPGILKRVPLRGSSSEEGTKVSIHSSASCLDDEFIVDAEARIST